MFFFFIKLTLQKLIAFSSFFPKSAWNFSNVGSVYCILFTELICNDPDYHWGAVESQRDVLPMVLIFLSNCSK